MRCLKDIKVLPPSPRFQTVVEYGTARYGTGSTTKLAPGFSIQFSESDTHNAI